MIYSNIYHINIFQNTHLAAYDKTQMVSQVYTCDIIGGGNPVITKLKYQFELIHVYKSADNWYWHN